MLSFLPLIPKSEPEFSKSHFKHTLRLGISLIPFVYVDRPVQECMRSCDRKWPLHCAPSCLLSLILPVCQFTVSERANQSHFEVFTTTSSPITRGYYFCFVYLSFLPAWPVRDRDHGSISCMTMWEKGWTGCEWINSNKLSNFERISVGFSKWWNTRP